MGKIESDSMENKKNIDRVFLYNDNNITKAIVTITYSNINKLNSLEE